MHLVSLKDGKMSHSGDNNIRIKPAVCDVFAISRLYFSLIRHLLIKKKRGSETPDHALGYLYLCSYFTVTR